jgi:hypothetical protein
MHTGRKHYYLGIDIEFNKDDTLDISTLEYLQNMLADFLETITGRAATPATDHLFKIRDKKEARILNNKQASAFHHTMAQLLFMAPRARREI